MIGGRLAPIVSGNLNYGKGHKGRRGHKGQKGVYFVPSPLCPLSPFCPFLFLAIKILCVTGQ